MIATICPDRQTLLRYSLGTLPADERDALDSHLDSCPDCQAVIVTLDDADDTAIGRLRMPLSGESLLAEPQLQDALAAAMGMPARTPDAADMPEMLGEYRLIEELGRGGMGRVYKALHTKLDRVVAVKVLPRGCAGDGNAANRFAREMRAVGRLAHPNIVQAHDAREIDGTAVLIMEFVDGLDLAEIVRRGGAGCQPASQIGDAKQIGNLLHAIPVPDACELVRQTALALQCAHEHGLVHRDVKPSNIMLARSGEAKLLDLGLARFFSDGGASGAGASPVFEKQAGRLHHVEEMTGTGQAMGTADYMAPEQASDSRTVDIRADIYSLGCTLYKLLTGRAPFSGPEYRTTLDKMNAHVNQPVPPIRQIVPEVPEQLAAVLDRMLAKDPKTRFATPAEVAEAVAPFCAGADLPALLREAESQGQQGRQGRQGRQGESSNLPSPSGRGRGTCAAGRGEGVSAAPQPAAQSRRRKPNFGQLLALLLFGGLCFALGIIITIRKNGQTYQIEPPPNSRTVVDPNGNATVDIGKSREGGPAPVVVNPAADLKDLQGKWNVAAVQKGNDMDKAFADLLDFGSPVDPANLYRLDFREGRLWEESHHDRSLFFVLDPRIWSGEYNEPCLSYRIDPTATPKTMDIFSVTNDGGVGAGMGGMGGGMGMGGEKENLKALAIYELQGDHLKIAMRRYSPSIASNQRPKRFAVEPGSDTIVLQLDRYRPTAGDRAMQATWKVVQQLDDGKVVPPEKLRGRSCLFADSFVKITDPSRDEGHRETYGQWVINSTKEPKTISILSYDWSPAATAKPTRKTVDFHGIYKFDGDRLTIAYRENRPPPEKFESTPGSGVTLVVLKKVHAEAAAKRQDRAQSPPAAPPATVRVTQPVVCNVCDYEEYSGQIEKGDVPITAPVKGRVLILPREEGPDRFQGTAKEGDAIAEIIPESEAKVIWPELRSKWDRLYAAQRESADLSQRLARAETPEHHKALQKALKDRKAAFDELNATLGNLKSTRILAPCSGLVSPHKFAGFDIGEEIGWIKPTDAALVSFDVPERTVLAHRRLRSLPSPSGRGAGSEGWLLSLPVVCALADDKGFPYRGKVVSVAEDIDPKTHTQRWQALVPNKNGLFMPGMSVRVRVITSEPHKVMLIPCELVRAGNADGGFQLIDLVDASNRLNARKVKLGRTYDAMIAVTEGLRADDWVVTGAGGFGFFAIEAGTEVKPKKVTTPPPPWAAISVPTAVSVVRPVAREVADYEIFTDRYGSSYGRVGQPVVTPVNIPVTGTLEKVYFDKIGQTVKKGDLLAEILPKTETDKLAQLEVTYADAQAPPAHETAKGEEKIKAAKKALEDARAKLTRTKVLAPCAGKIATIISYPPSAWVTGPTGFVAYPLTSIASPDSITAAFDIDEQTVIRLRRSMAGQKPDWELSLPVSCGLPYDKGFPIRGKVSSVESAVDPKTGTQRWYLVLPNKDGVLVPGMKLRVRLPTSAPYKALLLPEQALHIYEDDPYAGASVRFVFVVNSQNVAERRDVRIGQLQDDDLRVVTKGLSGDDRVILEPYKVTAGMTVKPEEPPAAPAPAPTTQPATR